MEYDVFLSHSNFDDRLAEDVKSLLEHNAIRTFVTPSSISSGKWEPQIEEALQNSADVWVLLTEKALQQSVWVHQELGYFYGFRHGQGFDPLGRRSHYVCQDGIRRPGLYAELQGVVVDNLGDPVVVARAIANNQGKQLVVPDELEPHTYPIATEGDRSHEQQFEREVQDTLQSQLSKPLANQGHWQVVIRPSLFQAPRISNFSSLYSLVKKSQVRLVGWEFPSMESETYSQSGANWIGDEFNEDIPEAWRLYQSGLFVSLTAYSGDLDLLSDLSGLPRDRLFEINSAIYFLTCAFKFAAAIANTEAGDDNMLIAVSANNLAGRTLTTPKGLLRGGPRTTSAISFPYIMHGSRVELTGQPEELAANAAVELFKRFRWNPAPQEVRKIQSRLLRH